MVSRWIWCLRDVDLYQKQVMSVPARSVNANFAQTKKIVIIQAEPPFLFISRPFHKELLGGWSKIPSIAGVIRKKQVVCNVSEIVQLIENTDISSRPELLSRAME